MTTDADTCKYRALLLPWAARGLETLRTDGTAWHDGDTFNALVSRGEHDYLLTHVRCAGYDAPELSGTSKPAGLAALAFAQTLAESGSIVFLDSYAFVAADEEDSFGRMLAAVTLPDGRDLAAMMLAAGHGVPD